MKGHVREVRSRLRALGRRPAKKCRDCAGPRIAWDQVPADAPVRCGQCGRVLDYVVYRWKAADDDT